MRVGLIGNPNVGKSLLFNELTGLGVEVSNYPGTTVEVSFGTVCFGSSTIELTDIPGIYSLDSKTESEQLARGMVLSNNIDVYIAVLDATHLLRNLYLFIQLCEFKRRVIIVLNMVDELKNQGISVDTKILEQITGVPVLYVSARTGMNIDEIVPAAMNKAAIPDLAVPYEAHIEAGIKSLSTLCGITREEALMALLEIHPDVRVNEFAKPVRSEISNIFHMTIHQIIATNRHNFALSISGKVMKKTEHKENLDLNIYLTSPITGLILLILIFGSLLCFVFLIGSWMDRFILFLFQFFITPVFSNLQLTGIWNSIGQSVLLGLEAGFGVAFPFILTFYLLVSLLEDTGYLTRAAFLCDRALHRFGLHGIAVIPLVLGLGCNVPAIMGLRLLRTKKQRRIAALMILLTPCSGRTVVIAGLVAIFVGIIPALSIYCIIVVLILASGYFVNKVSSGSEYGMVLEMPPLRRPRPADILEKTFKRVKEFLFIAIPALLVTSTILGIIQYYNGLLLIEQYLQGFSEVVLGLPSYATTALIFGILRKEMAVEILAVLAGTAQISSVMDGKQIYIFALINALFIPCVPTVAILFKEIGAKYTVLYCTYVMILGILIGALINILI